MRGFIKVCAASGVFITADTVTRELSETDCYKQLEVISRKRLEGEQIFSCEVHGQKGERI